MKANQETDMGNLTDFKERYTKEMEEKAKREEEVCTRSGGEGRGAERRDGSRWRVAGG